MSTDRVVYATSTEYVPAEVRARINGEPFDPTADVVEMAFVDPDVAAQPIESDWNPAIWETAGTGASTTYQALCLVGPDGVTLDPGRYVVFVRVTDDPEVPVIRADGRLTIV